MGVIGSSIKRREDPALITGRGRYTDDLSLPGMLHAVIVRSPHAHARIVSIDAAAARAAEGVVAVYDGRDLVPGGEIKGVPTGWLLPDLKVPVHPLLAVDRVRYVGDGVAVVVAESRYAARDAADLVEVEYEPLPAVVDPAKATADGAPRIHDEAPENVAFDWQLGDREKTDAAFAAATKVARLKLRNNRLIPHAVEPRACLADYDPTSGELTLRMTSQNPHVHRLLMHLASMGLPEHKMRIIAPEVGGGFGSKIHHYPDEAITAWCAINLKRPVKWTATRSEANLTDAHGRDHATTAELALDDGGRILGLRVETYAAMGAYLSTFAASVPTYLYGTLLSGQYDIPAIHVHVYGVFTNTTPVDAYRGAGRPEATFVVERLMDAAAEVCGLDPAAIRRRNFVPPEKFPYPTQVALEYDSGNYEPALDKALELAGYDALREAQKAARDDPKKPLIGIGLSSYIEACGLAPSQVVGALGAQAGLWESAKIRVQPSGSVTVYTGSSAHGQGHHTTFAQIVADKLGIDPEQVEVVHGDTEKVQFGMGTYGSRSAAVGGSAIATATDKVVAKARKIAAHLLEAAEEDVVFDPAADGGPAFHVRGVPDKRQGWGDVVLQAYLAHNYPDDLEPGLEETSFYNPSNFVYPFGTHVAVVEIDRETGEVRLARYVAVDDCGNQINPMIVAGQVHGGIAQGVGQALWEQAVYDDSGQLVTGTLLDYAVPRAHNLPSFETDHTVTPCPHNPLGVKGIGEAGTIASPAAVVNAVVDALKPYGVNHLDMPITPEKVWRAIHLKGAL
ncbi:MAG: xanthine dehydrogenase family protein molybdopterin-binding subunit [Acidobacteria bacterium]|nr:MAG: xanthine dehydrogenase family protein molybdopterin-binding subunit [Acidobacteriota bacterium]